MPLSTDSQFLFALLDVVSRTYAINIKKKVREILAGCDATLLRQRLNGEAEIHVIGIEQIGDIVDPELSYIFIEVHSFVFIDVDRQIMGIG